MLKAFALLLLVAVLCAANGEKIGIIHVEYNPPNTLLSVINETFPGSEMFFARFETPTANWMSRFEALLIFSDANWFNQTLLGDLVAEYIEKNDGRVVVGVFDEITCCAGSVLRGAFSPKYEVMVPVVGSNFKNYNNVTAIPPYFQNHPITQGLSTAGVWSRSLTRLPTNATLVEGSYRVLDWADGSPFIAVRDGVGPFKRSRVDLGWWIIPDEDDNSGTQNKWLDPKDVTGQLMKNLVINSLKYVLRNDTYLCGGAPFDVCSNSLPDFQTELSQYRSEFLSNFTIIDQSPAMGISFSSPVEVNITITTPTNGSLSCSFTVNPQPNLCPSLSGASVLSSFLFYFF